MARPAPGAATVAAHAVSIRKQIIRVVAGVGEGYLLQGLGTADILAALYFS
jgi:transketolase N-terminal domain/subunit